MKDFDHIMSVWQEQPKRDQLSVDEALKQVKRGMGGLSKTLLFSIVSMLAALAGMFLVMIFLVFNSWITYLGIGIMLGTMLLYVGVMIKDYKLINKRDITNNPNLYLQELKEYQRRRANLYGWLYYLYVLMLSLGLSLYLFEVLHHLSSGIRFASYALIIGWLLFCTFYLKDRIF
ncbi:MAG: hypothetical protein EOP46_03085, partial [Sphingobacteriaceae bacterium]